MGWGDDNEWQVAKDLEGHSCSPFQGTSGTHLDTIMKPNKQTNK